jgi:hypothetical protein
LSMSEVGEIECRISMTPHVERLTDLLVAALRELIRAGHPQATYLFWFEYDCQGFADSFPVMFYRRDRSGRADEGQELLPGVSVTIPQEIMYDPQYEQLDVDTIEVASSVFVPWFADCWKVAGGDDSPWPGYLAHHDSIYSFDLTARRKLRSPEPNFPDA